MISERIASEFESESAYRQSFLFSSRFWIIESSVFISKYRKIYFLKKYMGINHQYMQRNNI